MSGVLAIIPARGGSKRIPDKNIVDFCGKPLIAYSLTAANESGLFDEIHVSTDDAAIATVASEQGFPPEFMRPPELADDHTPLVPVLRWVLEEYTRRGYEFESVCLLMACAPLVRADDLQRGYRALNEGGRPVLSVARYPAPVEWAYDLDANGALHEQQPGKFALRSQDIAPSYYDTGTFAFISAETLRDPKYQGGGEMTGVVLPPQGAVDIDEPEDLILAKALHWGLSHIDP